MRELDALNQLGGVVLRKAIDKSICIGAFEAALLDHNTLQFHCDPDDVEYTASSEDIAAFNTMGQELLPRLEELFGPLFLEYHFIGFGANTDIAPWHNDFGSAYPRHNVTVNCFFDNVLEDGQFQIRHKDSDSITTLLPNSGDVIVFNQNPQWLHRVTPSNKLRRVISFAATIPAAL